MCVMNQSQHRRVINYSRLSFLINQPFPYEIENTKCFTMDVTHMFACLADVVFKQNALASTCFFSMLIPCIFLKRNDFAEMQCSAFAYTT